MAAGSITWDLLMRTASFETDTKKAEKRLQSLKKEAEAFGKVLGGTVVAGATAMAYAMKSAIDTADGFAKMKSRTGVATEALSGLAYGASLADVEIGDLQGALARVGKLMGEAADGSDTATRALARFGITKFDNVESAFSKIAEATRNTSNETTRASALADVLGKSFASLLPLLEGGAQGIKQATSEAAAYGAIVSGQLADDAAQFNDNLTRTETAAKGAAMGLAQALLPALKDISEFTVRAQAEYGAFLGMLVGGVGGAGLKALGLDLSGAETQFEYFARQSREAYTEYDKLRKLVEAAPKNPGFIDSAKLANDTAKMVAAYAEYNKFKKLRDANAPVKEADPAKGIGADTTEADKAALAARKKRAAEAEAETKRQLAEQKRLRKELEDEGKRMAEAMQTPSEKRDSSVGNVNKLAGAGVIDPETQKRALADAESTYQEYVTRQREMLTDGLLSEEDQIAASYERRKQMILALTEATEQEKAAAIASLSEKAEADQAAARLARYRDVLTEEQSLTADYNVRRHQIEDDSTLSAEQRTQYLTALSEKYHASMNALDEADAKKKKDLQNKQLELVSQGFSGAAELAKTFAGEQSAAYQVMFAASKAFALAKLTIDQASAIGDAWAKNNYWVAAGLTASLAAQFAALISSTQSASFGGTRADGGPVNTGRSYLVGERGPEMFTPNQGGRIVPNDAMGGQQQAQPIRIVNAFDDGHIDDYLGSDSGERKIVNAVRRNKRALGIAC